MEPLFWILMPCSAAGGAAIIAIILMQARMDRALARQKEALIEERIRAAEQEARRKAMEEFLAAIRVDERRYVRSARNLADDRKTVVVQERICFRNVPLTAWTRHEYVMDKASGFEGVVSRPPREIRLIAESTCP